MYKLVHAPHPTLFQKVKKVGLVTKKIRDIVYKMEETLIAQTNPQGVGLAAPQIGLDLAIFLIKPEIDSDTEVFINPVILQKSTGGVDGGDPDSVESPQMRSEPWRGGGRRQDPSIQKTGSRVKARDDKKDIHLEGCLSIPRIWGPVNRAEKVLVSYQDLSGKQYTKWFDGFKAIIIQHEMDHLEGTLFTQRVLEQKGKLYEEKDGELSPLDN